jgi:hypothetical protein
VDFVRTFNSLAGRASAKSTLDGFQYADGTIQDLFYSPVRMDDDAVQELYRRMVEQTGDPLREDGLSGTLGSVGKDLIGRTIDYTAAMGSGGTTFDYRGVARN